MLRIAICDDSQDARLRLRGGVEQALDKLGHAGEIFEFSSGLGLLGWLEKHTGELDLVFLDMEMGQPDGMETAKRLRAAYEGCSWCLSLPMPTGSLRAIPSAPWPI